MGFNDHVEKKSAKGRGSVKNASRLAAFKKAPEAGTRADWGKARPDILTAVVVAATWNGVQVTFLTSRDGGAYGLTLYDAGERVQLWFNGDCDLDAELMAVYDHLEALGKA